MSVKESEFFQNGLHLRFLRESWEVGDFTDVTLVAHDGSHMEAHRLVLGLHSSVFSNLFKFSPSSSQTHVVVYLRGVKRTCLDLLLKLMYMGMVEVERDMVEEFIALCKELKVDIEGGTREEADLKASVEGKFEHIAANEHILVENADEKNQKVASWNVYQSNDSEISAKLESPEELLVKQEVAYNTTPIFNEWLSISEDDISEAQPNDAVVLTNNENEGKSIIDEQQIFETSLVQSIDNSILCKKCDSNFKTKKGLWFHTQSKHLGVTHKCDECDKIYNVKPALDRHKSVIHKGTRYKCDQCPVMLYTSRALRIHLKRHAGQKEPCDVCDKVFRGYTDLRRHKNQDHLGSSVEMYFCNICDWSGTRRQLAIHKQSIHEGVVFKCDNCDYKATQRGSLVSHMAKHEVNKFKCNVCEKSFRQEAVLTKHIQSAHEGVWHFCNECDRSFSLLSSLNTHKTCIHENATQPKAKSKKFLIQKFEKLANQSCDQSDLSTTANFELKKHVRESQIAEFNCQMCESLFTEKQKLDAHVKNKHDGVSYNCDKCKFKSSIKMDLVGHKETAHPTLIGKTKNSNEP